MAKDFSMMFNVCIGDQPGFHRRTALIADGYADEAHLDLMFYRHKLKASTRGNGIPIG